MEKVVTRELTNENKDLDYSETTSFLVFGELQIVFNEKQWSYTEKMYEESYEKSYNYAINDKASIIENDEKTLFYALLDDEIVGQIVIKSYWNKFCYIDDLKVSKAYRQRGIASSLLSAAKTWAMGRDLKGLMLETQNINISACRCYLKNGFFLGSVDTMLYHNFDTKNELALLFYKVF